MKVARTVLLIWFCVVPIRGAGAQVLFDAALGTAPSAQGWPFIANSGNSVTETVFANYTTVDSLSPITDQGGYFSEDPILGILTHPDMPTIDRSVGYQIRFDVRVNAETHVLGPPGDDDGDGLEDRAGFSVIAISEDLEGIEIGFWENRVWAQDDDLVLPGNLFTQAEGSALDTTAEILRYDLRVFDDSYQLIPGGGVAPVIAGRLRNYTNFAGGLDPYEIPNFLFLGDDTTRAEAQFDIAYIEIDALGDPAADADALVAAIVAGTDDPFFDLTGDGLVNSADLTEWLCVSGNFYQGAAFLPGDANLDGAVDGLDFSFWNANKFTASAAWTAGDFNADGVVDGLDLLVWNGFKFQSPVRSVPESCSGLLMLLAGAGLWRRRRESPDG